MSANLKIFQTHIRFPHRSTTPATPPATTSLVYVKTDGRLYRLGSDGIETDVATTLADTGVVPGSYESADVTVNAKGQITAISDAPDSGVTPGSYTAANITVDPKGRITVASSNVAVPAFPTGVPGTYICPLLTLDTHGKVTAIESGYYVNPAINDLRMDSSINYDPNAMLNTTDNSVMRLTFWRGNTIALSQLTETNYKLYQLSTQPIISLGTLPVGVYDVFVYASGSTLVAEFIAWSTLTSRATALEWYPTLGIYGTPSSNRKKYIGSIYLNVGQTHGTFTRWNYFNRLTLHQRILETTASWTYATSAWRQVRASGANLISLLIGMNNVPITLNATLYAQGAASLATNIGFSTTAPLSGSLALLGGTSGAATTQAKCEVQGNFHSHTSTDTVGFLTFYWLERGNTSGTFLGTSVLLQSGMEITYEG
jgi:hypothetical protein